MGEQHKRGSLSEAKRVAIQKGFSSLDDLWEIIEEVRDNLDITDITLEEMFVILENKRKEMRENENI